MTPLPMTPVGEEIVAQPSLPQRIWKEINYVETSGPPFPNYAWVCDVLSFHEHWRKSKGQTSRLASRLVSRLASRRAGLERISYITTCPTADLHVLQSSTSALCCLCKWDNKQPDISVGLLKPTCSSSSKLSVQRCCNRWNNSFPSPSCEGTGDPCSVNVFLNPYIHTEL